MAINRREFIAAASGAVVSGATVPAIFGGRQLVKADYPYVQRLDTQFGIYTGRCGATHIGDGLCATAAHCIVDEGVTAFAFGGRRIAKIDGRFYVFAPRSYRRDGLTDDIGYIYDPELVGKPFIPLATAEQFRQFREAVNRGDTVNALSVGYGTTRLDSVGRPTDVSDTLKGLDVVVSSATRRSISVADPTKTGGVCVGDSGSALIHGDVMLAATSSVSFNPATGSYCDVAGWEAKYQSFERELDVIATLKAGLAEFVG